MASLLSVGYGGRRVQAEFNQCSVAQLPIGKHAFYGAPERWRITQWSLEGNQCLAQCHQLLELWNLFDEMGRAKILHAAHAQVDRQFRGSVVVLEHIAYIQLQA